MSLFEQASRQKLRFPSSRGELTSEQLWDLPLIGKGDFSLDHIARAIHQELKSVSEDSFVVVSQNPAKKVLELKMDIVKHVIATKQQEAADAVGAAARAAERQRLLQALNQKQDQELASLSSEDIQKRLAELG